MNGVVCYPQPGKPKSRLLLEAFARGAHGVVAKTQKLDRAPAAFYGVVGLEALWGEVAQRGHPYYYLDNAFFDNARGRFFRVGVNALQDTRPCRADPARLAALKVKIAPWREGGRHIVVCQQSRHFMKVAARWPGGVDAWLAQVLDTLRRHTERRIVVREWLRDKALKSSTLAADLQNAWALVTHMSAAANEAIAAGIPAFVTGPCAALEMGCGDLSRIETPPRPDGREDWAAQLAAKQWTVEELAAGLPLRLALA